MVKLGLKLFSNSQMLASKEIRKKPPRAQVRSSLGYNSSFTVKQKPNKPTNHHHNNPRSMASLAFLLPTRNMNEREVSEQPFFPVGNLDRLCPAGLWIRTALLSVQFCMPIQHHEVGERWRDTWQMCALERSPDGLFRLNHYMVRLWEESIHILHS